MNSRLSPETRPARALDGWAVLLGLGSSADGRGPAREHLAGLPEARLGPGRAGSGVARADLHEEADLAVPQAEPPVVEEPWGSTRDCALSPASAARPRQEVGPKAAGDLAARAAGPHRARALVMPTPVYQQGVHCRTDGNPTRGVVKVVEDQFVRISRKCLVHLIFHFLSTVVHFDSIENALKRFFGPKNYRYDRKSLEKYKNKLHDIVPFANHPLCRCLLKKDQN